MNWGINPVTLAMDLDAMPRKTDKRVRLIEAAKVLIHQKGFNQTTLADIHLWPAISLDSPSGTLPGMRIVERTGADGVIPFLKEDLADPCSDEAGCACDEDFGRW